MPGRHDDDARTGCPGGARAWGLAGWIALFVVIGVPHVARLRAPSLYSDDLVRLSHLRVMTPGAMLIRPFNEHFAPLFEVISLLGWALSGHRLDSTPGVFTALSLAPGLLSIVALSIVLRLETGSWMAARIAAVMLGLAILPLETFWWYSASSFTWALLLTLLGWWGASRGGVLGLVTATLAAMLAPAASAIGLLAGPLATVRVLSDPGRAHREGEHGSIRRIMLACLPLLGLASFTAIAASFGHGRVVTQSLEHSLDLRKTAETTLMAVPLVLIPAQVGVTDLDRVLPRTVSLALGLAPLILVIWASVLSRGSRRALYLVGIVLVYGGYSLAFAARASYWSEAELLRVQRYHLFPQVGLLAWLIAALAPRLCGLEAGRPRLARWLPLLLAGSLLATHRGDYRNWSLHFRFEDQPATFAAVGRVEALCRSRGITREQALAALASVEVPWMPVKGIHPFCFLETGPHLSARTVDDAEVRDLLSSALSLNDREALWGGIDVTSGMSRVGHSREVETWRFVRASRMERVDGGEATGVEWEATSPPSYVEYDRTPGASVAPTTLTLGVVCEDKQKPVELWWSPDGRDWSRGRSIRWKSDTESELRMALDLSEVPNWEAGRARRLRVVLRDRGRVSIAPPGYTR